MSSVRNILSRLPAGEYGQELVLACLMGMTAGIGALILEFLVCQIGHLRIHLLSLAPALLVLPLLGAAGGLVSGALVQFAAPTASGSGIPQVRAFLLGKPVPLDLPVVFVKLIGGSVALGCGLFSGREGPTVHAGAAIAMQLSKLMSISTRQARQLVAAGAGAGLAAAFNAPLAGVLFVAEELLKDVSVTTMRVALAACFVSSVTTKLLDLPHLEANRQVQSVVVQFAGYDIAFWVLLGVLCGLLGTAFSKSVLACCAFNRDVLKIPVCLKVALAGTVCGLVIASLIPFHHFENYAALRSLFATGAMDLNTLALAFVTFFFLSAIVYGSGSPGGLFAPTLVLGSSLGAMVAHLEGLMFGCGSLETMALIGMGAMFAAVARVPLTALVIIVEMTGHYDLLLPLMIAISAAVFVASKLESRSVYDLLREFAGLGGDQEPTSVVTVGEVMSYDFIKLENGVGQREVQAALSQGKPVVFVKEGRPYFVASSKKALQIATLPENLQAEDLMDGPPEFASPNDPVTEIAARLASGGDVILVMDAGALVGVVSPRDVLNYRKP